MRNTGKRYSDDFKKMIIEIYNSGKPVQEIYSEYGITSATLYKWLKNPPCSEAKPVIKADSEPKAANNLIIRALKNAYDTQKPSGPVIFHSDLGTQYTSEAYTKQLGEYNMISSYSGKGCPYDNACIVSFHSILKKEEVNRVIYYDYATARLELF